MRPVLHGDVRAAAMRLLAAPAAVRPGLVRRMLSRAEAADAYRRRTGRLHPEWGNGSLLAAAGGPPGELEPPLDDAAYCECLAVVLSGIAAWRAEKARLNRPRRRRISGS